MAICCLSTVLWSLACLAVPTPIGESENSETVSAGPDQADASAEPSSICCCYYCGGITYGNGNAVMITAA